MESKDRRAAGSRDVPGIDALLARNLNQKLPAGVRPFMEPGERAIVVIRGIPGAIVATNRRVIVERTATPLRPEIYAYRALNGAVGHLELIGKRSVALTGPGLKDDPGVFQVGRSRNALVVNIWDVPRIRTAVVELNTLIEAMNAAPDEGPDALTNVRTDTVSAIDTAPGGPGLEPLADAGAMRQAPDEASPLIEYQATRRWTRVLVGLLALHAVVCLFLALSEAILVSGYWRFGAGLTRLADLDGSTSIVGQLSSVSGALAIATFALLPIWLFRSMRNAPALGAAESGSSPSMGFVTWFVPFVSLIVPYRILLELRSRLASPDGRRAGAPLIVVFWAASLTHILFSVALSAATRGAGDTGVSTGVYALEAIMTGALLIATIFEIAVVVDLQSLADGREARVFGTRSIGEPAPSAGGRRRLLVVPLTVSGLGGVLLLAVAGNTLAGRPADPAWATFRSTAGGFEVSMPRVPTDERSTTDGGEMRLVVHSFESRFDAKELFTVSYTDYEPGSLSSYEPRDVLEKLVSSTTGDFKSLGSQTINLGLVPGRMVTLRAPDGEIALTRYYLQGDRVYRVVADTTDDRKASPSIGRFFRSFAFLPGQVETGRLAPYVPKPWSDLRAGDCYNSADVTGPGVEALPSGGGAAPMTIDRVSCSAPHSFEVFALASDPASPVVQYPGDQVEFDRSNKACDTPFEQYVGIDYEASRLSTRIRTPIEWQWDRGDRLFVCSLFDPNQARLIGSQRGSYTLYRSDEFDFSIALPIDWSVGPKPGDPTGTLLSGLDATLTIGVDAVDMTVDEFNAADIAYLREHGATDLSMGEVPIGNLDWLVTSYRYHDTTGSGSGVDATALAGDRMVILIWQSPSEGTEPSDHFSEMLQSFRSPAAGVAASR